MSARGPRLTPRLADESKAQLRFAPAGFFVLRTPLLPFEEFLAWGRGPSVKPDGPSFAQSHAEACARLRERLHALVSEAPTREAVFVACPDLVGWVERWRAEPETKRGRNTERALTRYFTRMTGRPVPFGLFAGFSVGLIADGTSLTVEARAKFQRRTRLDFDYLLNLSEEIAASPALKKKLVYHPNSSLYRAGGRVRYFESRRDERGRAYQLVAVEETQPLSATLKLAVEGRRASELAAALVDDEISSEEAEAYVNLLIDNQILMPDLSLPVTGRDPLGSLIKSLREHALTRAAARTLTRARTELKRIDREGLGVESCRYEKLKETLKGLPVEPDPSRLFHVELMKPAPGATLGGPVLEEITRGVALLHRVCPNLEPEALTHFREAFHARYEEAEVPLAEALDDEYGVGFGDAAESSPVTANVDAVASHETRKWDARQAFLLQKLCHALERGEDEIVIDDDDIEKLSERSPLPLPGSFAAIAKVAASSQAALDEGEFRVLVEGVSGPSGATLLGRFCHADVTLRSHVARHLRAEQDARPEVVFAEVVHVPEGRAGNVVTRPALREYEIPYLGRAGVPTERQIPVSDLTVSVRGGRVRLRSQRLGREVVPRLTSAHEFNVRRPGLYRFLCSLQYQGVAGELTWSWGALSTAPFLPRVACGRLVLSPARWHVNVDELRELDCRGAAERFQAVRSWRARRRLPEVVALTDDESSLPVDFNNALSVESFALLVRGRERATLVELFPAPRETAARAPEGAFLHQLIVPFIGSGRDAKPTAERRAVKEHAGKNVCRRTFTPGSEWLYAKLYAGPATTDIVLREMARPLVRAATRRGLADGWFFVRYEDPHPHLRLRFRGTRARLNAELLPLLQTSAARMARSGHVWRFQLDTYEREIERYGGAEGITLAEELFHADSEAALAVVEILARAQREDISERRRLAVLGVDLLLDDLGFDLSAKSSFVKRARDAYAEEHGAGKKLRERLSEQFRRERQDLNRLFAPDPPDDATLKACLKVFARRSQALSGVARRLKQRAATGRLSLTLQELALSYAHMHVNRLLPSSQREHELFVYDFLARLYDARAARAELSLNTNE
ncbi:MAG TPA: lantibiotic dehydratase [Pyrinomonadaceae bacterium]